MIGDELVSLAALVAKVEDAGPGAMTVLRAAGLRPSEYAKRLASLRAHADRDPALGGAFAGAVASARRGELRVPTAISPSREATTATAQQASFQLAGAAATAQPKAPAPPMQAPSPGRPKLGGTSLALDVPQKAALPFLKPDAGAGDAPAPSARLTLQQHASLTAEIAARPELAMATLTRYRITPDQKRALDAHYCTAIADDPELRASWEGAYRTYGEWLATAGWKG